MFTGIIESLGEVRKLESEGTNLHLTIHSGLTPELKIDQSLAHNGVCLTVVQKEDASLIYTVTAIKETLDVTNLSDLEEGSTVNLERCLKADGRLDGHFVQGHVDQMAECIEVKEEEGSWYFHFRYQPTHKNFLVHKGSVCLNGISLTVAQCQEDEFSVAIIPYTYEHTTFSSLKVGDRVNLEFDMMGKYLSELYFRNKD